MTDNNALAQEVEAACQLDAKTATDAEWSRLLCAALNVSTALRTPAPASGEVGDLVTRLRTMAKQLFGTTASEAMTEAADMLERLAGPVQQPAICEHGIRHPWACQECDDAAWRERQPVQQTGGYQVPVVGMEFMPDFPETQPVQQPEDQVDRVARAIARANGDEFANAFKSKDRWTAKRGMSGGRFRDVNEPFQSDYLEMARAAIAAMEG